MHTFSGLNLNLTNTTSPPPGCRTLLRVFEALPLAAQRPVNEDRLAHVGARLAN